jgi:hypothetical protein
MFGLSRYQVGPLENQERLNPTCKVFPVRIGRRQMAFDETKSTFILENGWQARVRRARRDERDKWSSTHECVCTCVKSSTRKCSGWYMLTRGFSEPTSCRNGPCAHLAAAFAALADGKREVPGSERIDVAVSAPAAGCNRARVTG